MDNADLTAIANFDNNAKKYLTVVKDKSGKEHLDVVERNFFGRIWMKLGFSSSSMKKVANYINTMVKSNSDVQAIRNNPETMKGIDKLAGLMSEYNENHRIFAATPVDEPLIKIRYICREDWAEKDSRNIQNSILSLTEKIQKIQTSLRLVKLGSVVDNTAKIDELSRELSLCKNALEDKQNRKKVADLFTRAS
ncbi:MAG: hypothetical protein LLF94_02585 [Chlamydiales bacterium]|nr:hypothetical protein [Chlamydiales bacterium]